MTFKQWTDFVIQYKVYTAIRETLFKELSTTVVSMASPICLNLTTSIFILSYINFGAKVSKKKKDTKYFI